ncbi:MAG: septal ring lytic transglycosylase RlpA family protein [Chitinophagaceae bacterium]
MMCGKILQTLPMIPGKNWIKVKKSLENSRKNLLMVGFLFPFFGFGQSRFVKQPKIQYGIASFYSKKFNGRRTASGEIYNDHKMTAANNTLPFGTYLRITNLHNGRSVIVRVNDRLSKRNRRLVDVTRSAAQKLGIISRGITRVKMVILKRKRRHLFSRRHFN